MTSVSEKLELPHQAGEHDSSRIPALDGVRGLAIFMVLAFHCTHLWKDSKFDVVYGAMTRFGWAGVDLFFVLSGFLITGILLSSKGQEHFFRNFYARRVLRIFPLYYLIIFLATIVLPFTPLTQNENFRSVNFGPWTFPFGYTSNIPHWPFYWLYFANFPIVFTQDFANDMIGITWSLAIEEQFYMVWPFVVWFCTPKSLKKICLGMLSVSFLCRVLVAAYMLKYGDTRNNHRMSYELTFCRLDAISLGSFVAIIMHQGGMNAIRAMLPRIRWVGAAAAFLILVSIATAKKPLFHEHPVGQTIGYTAVGVFFACLLIWTLTSAKGGVFNRIFTVGWLRFLGKYSYAIYLFHMGIVRIVRDYIYKPEDFLMIANSKMPGQIIFYFLVMVPTIILALLSWNLMEKRFLSLKKYFPSHPPRVLTPAEVPAP